ncbi:MAG: zf-HC2 domain-containing protein [Clostridia bacterium]|nr:zf-HC2 domain-containing protein [Clostridia bacterium]
MKCRKARQLLSPYIDDELKPKEKAALEEHLASCEACRAELEELKAISNAIREIFQRIEPPPDLLEKTMRRIREMEESGEMERLRRRERLAKWRKAAMGVGLAAGIGLAALQFGRAGVGPVMPPGVLATEHAGSAAPQEEARVVVSLQENAGGEAGAPEVASAAPQGKAAAREAAKAGTRVAALPKVGAGAKGAVVAPTSGQPARPAGAAQLASAAGATGAGQRVFLSHSRHVRTTSLRLAVADLQAARLAVAVAAIEAGAVSVEEAWSYRQEQVILRVVLPVTGAGRFIAEVSGLGEVLGRSTEIADVTAESNRRLAEYQELSVRSDPQSRALTKAAEKVLEALDRESLEAGREVVNVWLALR